MLHNIVLNDVIFVERKPSCISFSLYSYSCHCVQLAEIEALRLWMNNNKEIFNKTQLYADKVKILNYLFFVDEMAAVLGYDLSMAREFL